MLIGLGVSGVITIGIIIYFYFFKAHTNRFSVTFFNIGQGDSALITFISGQKMLVDCGPDKSVLSKLGGALPFFDRTIDYLVVTHPDLDHYGGCMDVLKRYEVKEIITNGSAKNYDSYWRAWDAAARTEPATVLVTMASPTMWLIAGDMLQFFSPDPTLALDTSSADSNNHSIVFKLTHGTQSFLFTGDMEVPLETALLKKYCGDDVSTCPSLRAKFLKVSHHGSDTGSSETFLAAVQPTTAVISVGKNKYGHPSLRTIRHLERAGAGVKRTDELGNISVE